MRVSSVVLVATSLLLVLGAVACLASPLSSNEELRMNRIVERVNRDPNAGWRATNRIPWDFFEGKTMSLERMRSDPARGSVPVSKIAAASADLPTEFDWRQQTPYCVGYIRNQVWKYRR